MTLQQEYMKQAYAHVQQVAQQGGTLKKEYGSLCHDIPVLVLTNGLGLTAAFVASKAQAGNAFDLAMRHLAETLDIANPNNLPTAIANLGNGQYMQATFTVLDSWVYYKRFAVTLLGTKPGTGPDLTEIDREEA